MPFQWKEILLDWLLGEPLYYEIEDVVIAFNDVERIMGSGWLEHVFGQSRGTAVAIQVIELGKTLKAIENMRNGSKLISKIKNYYPFTIFHGNTRRKFDPSRFQSSDELHELAHALTVAQSVAHYRRHSLEVELEPELPVRTKIRHPDFRVKHDSAWVYVEVVCPGFSKEEQNINKILARIANVNDEIRMDRVAEVYLFKDPSDTEIGQIIDKCKSLAESDLQPQECIIGNTAQIFTNPWNQERLPTFLPTVNEKRPILGFIRFEIKNEGGITHGRKCNVNMPFTDERAQRILSEKSRQLSKQHPGLIIVDVSSVSGGLKRWPELIRRRLQPNLNRRISGVLVTESSISGKSMKTEKKFIEHPNPIYPLSQDFIGMTTSC
jgi:hypothetical protein